MTNELILKSFCKEKDIWDILYKFESDLKLNIDKVKDTTDDTSDYKNVDKTLFALMSSYRQKIFVKLNFVFRMQIVLDEAESEMFYNDPENFEFIYKRFELFYKIIDYINNTLEVAYIPDKLTACAYFRITAETWTTFLNYGNLSDGRVKSMFSSLEEFLISSTMTGVENGQLNKIAWRKLELKGKYGGNDVEYSTSTANSGGGIIDTVANKHQQLESKLKSKYNFVIDAPKEKKTKKEVKA